MRRLLLALTVAVASVAVARPASAQIDIGVQGAVLTSVDKIESQDTDLNGTWGLGARAEFTAIPMIGVIGQGVYYFPEGFDYLTYSLAGQLRLPLAVVTPYVIGGWQWRRTSVESSTETANGFMGGLGVKASLGITLFLEGTWEFNDERKLPDGSELDTNPFVIKGGIIL